MEITDNLISAWIDSLSKLWRIRQLVAGLKESPNTELASEAFGEVLGEALSSTNFPADAFKRWGDVIVDLSAGATIRINDT